MTRKWQNQILMNATNGPLFYQLDLNKRFGQLRNGIAQPQLDNFIQACKIEETELAFGRLTEEYNQPKQDIKEIIRFSQMEKLTQEAVDVFIKKVTIYRDKRVEIEWNYAFGEE